MEKAKEMSETVISFKDLPHHLILEVLITDRLSPIDLVNIESTSKVFGYGSYSSDFKSVADHAASRLCVTNPIYMGLSLNKQKGLVTKCKGNWKRVLRFLQSIVKYSRENIQRKKIGKEKKIVTNSRDVEYSCGLSMFGDHAQWPKARGHCVKLNHNGRLRDLSFSSQVLQVSASENNAAFVLQSGEVFTCGNNHLFGCGHSETDLPITSPKLVEALETIPCKQGRGCVELLKDIGPVVQISAGAQFVLAVTEDGSVYSFGDGYDFCLGHGDSLDILQPHAIQAFKTEGVHILRVCAGDRHVVAIDSNGDVYTWGRGGAGALGHGEKKDKLIPEVLLSLKNHLAVQICARKMNTFVEVEGGLVYGFGSEFGNVPRDNLSQNPIRHVPLGVSYGRLLSQCSGHSRRRGNRVLRR